MTPFAPPFPVVPRFVNRTFFPTFVVIGIALAMSINNSCEMNGVLSSVNQKQTYRVYARHSGRNDRKVESNESITRGDVVSSDIVFNWRRFAGAISF
jgi:hypothetical protein